jgi:hypothetical protein
LTRRRPRSLAWKGFGRSLFQARSRRFFHGNALTKHGDFANDVARGWVTFVAATVSPGEFSATAGVDVSVAAFSAPTVRTADERRASAVHGVGKVVLDRVSAFSTTMPIGPLSADESAVLAAVRAWHDPAANASKRASAASHGVPRVVVRAAVAATMGEKFLVDAVDESVLLLDIRSGARGTAASSPSLSRNFAKLRLEGDWETGILPAMEKEIGGLVESEV